MTTDSFPAPEPQRSPPAFNIPKAVLAAIAILIVVHLYRVTIAGPLTEQWMILNLSFIPGCYGALDEVCDIRSPGASVWTPLTYALLHADATHLALNSFWLLAFGSPVARRIGFQRFFAFVLPGAVAGAAVFFLVNPALIAPVIGASGAVSALMGGASRFAFQSGSGMTSARRQMRWTPLAPISQAMRNRTVVVFVAVFFATNLIFSTSLGSALGEGAVAWEAHLGGFVFGFLMFRFFDRVPSAS